MPIGSQAEKLKTKIVNEVAANTRKGLTGSRAKLAERFVHQLYARVPPDDILHEAAENLVGASVALLSFAKQRRETRPRSGSIIRIPRNTAGPRPIRLPKLSMTICRSWSIR